MRDTYPWAVMYLNIWEKIVCYKKSCLDFVIKHIPMLFHDLFFMDWFCGVMYTAHMFVLFISKLLLDIYIMGS